MFNTVKMKPLMFSLIALIVLIAFQSKAVAKSISINVFAIPSQPILDVMQQTSDTLKQHGLSSFYAQGKPAHVTLYLTEYQADKAQAINQVVANIAAQQQKIPLHIQGFSVSKSNWAFLNVERSVALQRLADQVVLALSPLRDQSAALPTWVKSYPNKIAAFKRYGSPNVFQNYQPHLTLLANESSPQLALIKQQKMAEPPTAQGEIIGIGIGIADHLGQQQQVIAEYFFKK